MRRAAFWLGLALVLVSGGISHGSGSTSWSLFGERDFKPSLGEPAIRVIVRALELDGDERAVVEDLHEAHVRRVYQEGGEVRRRCVELIEEAQLTGKGKGLEEVQEIQDTWRDRRERLDEEFLQELRLILTAEQEQRWAVVERELRRMEEMARGRMSGEGVDVIGLVDAAGVDVADGSEAAKVLERYARSIDGALRARAAYFEDHPMGEVRPLVESDPGEALRIFERARTLRMEVRDTNRRYVEEVASALGGEDGEKVRTAWVDRVAGYGAKRESIADNAIKGAKGLGSLSPEQVRTLEGIEERYAEERAEWTADYAEAVMEVEEDTIPQQLERALAGDGAPEELYQRGMQEWETERARIPELARVWRERLELDRRVRREVDGVLTEAQRGEMPLLVEYVMMSYGEVFGTDTFFSY